MEGTTFRHLRQLLGLTLSQTAKNICSVAALSRWETGQTEIPFNIAIKLLAKIQVNTGEFLTWQKKTNIFSQGLKTLIKALDTENIPLIKRETSKQIKKYRQHQHADNLYWLTVACNQLLIMTHHNYLPERERWHLFNHLSKINLWTQKHLSLFANSVFLLSPKMVYGLANQITAFIPKIEDDATLANLLTAFGGLGDAAIALILGRANNLAEKLLHKLNMITLPPYLMFFQLTYKFLRVIIKYTEDQEEQPVLAIISTLMSLGCTEQAAIFLDIFKEIKYQLQL